MLGWPGEPAVTVLANRAQSRENLLFILGGDVTRIAWSTPPERLDQDLALLFELRS